MIFEHAGMAQTVDGTPPTPLVGAACIIFLPSFPVVVLTDSGMFVCQFSGET